MRTHSIFGLLFTLFSHLALNIAPAQAATTTISDAALSTVLILALDRQESVIASGSGALVSQTGLVLTNYHVIADNQQRDGWVVIFVPRSSNANQEEDFTGYLGTILAEASDPDADMALIQIDRTLDGKKLPSRTKFPALTLGDSDELLIGDKLYIFGYPDISYNSLTLTDGLVSGFQEANGLPWILTAAVISHGNSGGVVINEQGDLVAVPTRVETGTFSEATMGYLRPINVAKPLIANVALAEEIAHADEDALVLFSDSFSNNDNLWEVKPLSDQYADCVTEITNDNLTRICQFKKQAMSWLAIPNLVVKDFNLSFEYTLAERNGNEAYTNLDVLFRQNEQGQYYAVSFSEQGDITINFVSDDQWQEIVAWTASEAFTALPGETNRFSVQMNGQEMLVFVNEQQVIASQDDRLQDSGALALAVSAPRGQHLAVQFDNLTVTAASDSSENSNNERDVSFEDTFDSNQNGWDLGQFSTDYNSGEDRISQGKLRSTIDCQQASTHPLYIPNIVAKNFLLTVDAKIVKSTDEAAGIIIRFHSQLEQDYQLEISNLGLYSLVRWNNEQEEWEYVEEWSETEAFATGNSKRNTIQLQVQDSQITLVINNEAVTTISDEENLSSGGLSLGASCSEGESVTAEFDNLSISTFATSPAEAAADAETTVINEITQASELPTHEPPTSTPESPTATPEPATPTPAPAAVLMVLVNQLNVRNGPGTHYGISGHANSGEHFTVIGQVNNCAWLQVQLPTGGVGWVSGGAQYTSLEGACSTVPLVTPPPTPKPAARRAAGGGSRQGCYLFRNYISAELTVTFTSSDGKWNTTFKVPNRGTYQACYAPGRYTVSVDAPPPWGGYNEAVEITAGMYVEWPVWGEN